MTIFGQMGGATSGKVPLRGFVFLLLPCLLPAFYRYCTSDGGEVAGILSDVGVGLIFFALLTYSNRLVRSFLLVVWGAVHIASAELLAAVGRLPSMQDIYFLTDPQFVSSSMAGLHLAHPFYGILFLVSLLPAVCASFHRLRLYQPLFAVAAGTALLFWASFHSQHGKGIASSYNSLQWLIVDSLSQYNRGNQSSFSRTNLPVSFTRNDLNGALLPIGGKKADNILIIVMEGISGIYHPEIRKALGVADGPYQMERLQKATRQAMLIPDFITHSHQTIRGLYAMHCGDFSKFSFETPKGMELLLAPDLAGQCLPAQLKQAGWATHFLQGAPLQFMNKDRIMGAMGFEEVHGFEWFSGRDLESFTWGATDPDLFAGALDYIHDLEDRQHPWMLTLLTVATHQPFDAPQDLVERYGDRKIASVARLDMAVAEFLNKLHENGILKNTLVLVTADESHGYAGADWNTSWGTMMVMAPDGKPLPRLKKGTYGLVDVESSVLDYMGLEIPAGVAGRSFFRDYTEPREMLSYTSGKVRYQMADNRLIECTVLRDCTRYSQASLLGQKGDAETGYSGPEVDQLFGMTSLLDKRVNAGRALQRFEFGHGEKRQLPGVLKSQWADNLVGAQYLDFPEKSSVDVAIRIKALAAGDAGIQLKLILREFEQEVKDIRHPAFPLLREGEACDINFSFDNQKSRKAFSFHLVGEGAGNVIQMEKFEVAINRHR